MRKMIYERLSKFCRVLSTVTIKKNPAPKGQELLQAAQIVARHFQSADTSTQKKIRKVLKDVL